MDTEGGSRKWKKAISAKPRIVLQPTRRTVLAGECTAERVKRNSAEDLGTPIAQDWSASLDAKGLGVLTH
jgi:hypothetical protein